MDSFKEQIENLHWKHVDFSKDPNKIYETFITTLQDVYNANFPIKTVKLRKKDVQCPWSSKGLKKSSKTKQKLYIKYLKTRTPESEARYKNYKNLFESLRKKAKRNYYSSMLDRYKNNSKRTWQIMKEIIGKASTQTNSLPKTIKINDQYEYDSKIIATEFNKFFTTVGSNLAQNIPPLAQTKFENFLTNTKNKLQHNELTFDEFEKALKTLKRNKATGVDEINGNIILDIYILHIFIVD